MGKAGVDASPTTHAIMVNALVQAGDCEGAEVGLRKLINLGEVRAYALVRIARAPPLLLRFPTSGRLRPSLLTSLYLPIS